MSGLYRPSARNYVCDAQNEEVEICKDECFVEDWFNAYLGGLQYVSQGTNVWFSYVDNLCAFKRSFK